MVEFQGVTKAYPNGTVALDGVSLRVWEGEFVFLVGVSGAGKSTLLKLILKEEEATRGRVLVHGLDLSGIGHRGVPYLRRNMGVVFQDFRLLPRKTVYENAAFAMEVVGEGSRAIRRRVPEALAVVGLASKADAYPSELSGGEQQRAAVARALVNAPPILIADEPTGNLDPATSREIMDLLRRVNLRGTTVLVATHERGIVDEMRMRVVEIDGGRVARDQEGGRYEDAVAGVPVR
jgi:cell division transport system ATP-binding protein